MPSDYPGALDSFTNPTSSDTLDSVTVPHADQHANANDAIEAIETELGTNPKGAAASVKDRLDTLDTTVSGKVGTGDSRLTDARTPTGSAGGGLTGTYPNPTIASGAVGITQHSATGTPSSTTFLRGDNTWSTPSASVSWPLTNSAASSTTNQYATNVTGDAANRFTVDAAGKHAWGDGINAADATLQRSAVGVLQLGAALDANSNSIYSAGPLAIGTTAPTLGSFVSQRSPTVSLQYVSATFNDSPTITTGGAFTFPAVIQASGTWTVNGTPQSFRALTFAPTIAGSATSYPFIGIYVQPNIGGNLTSVTLAQLGMGGGGTPTTTVGLDIGVSNALAGTTKWGFQVGNYQSYHQGNLTVGGTSAPTWNVHVRGGNSATNGIGIDVSTTGPTAPGSSASGVISVYKGATNWYLLVTFNDAGTTRYRYMQLNGTTATWTHATTLPT